MCETKSVVVSLSFLLLAAPSFFKYQAHTENNVGNHSEVKSQGPCDNEYKNYCLNGGEGYYLVDEDLVSSNCTWLFGGDCCEKYMWCDWVRTWILKKDENFSI